MRLSALGPALPTTTDVGHMMAALSRYVMIAPRGSVPVHFTLLMGMWHPEGGQRKTSPKERSNGSAGRGPRMGAARIAYPRPETAVSTKALRSP